jgi:hypothetical protein
MLIKWAIICMFGYATVTHCVDRVCDSMERSVALSKTGSKEVADALLKNHRRAKAIGKGATDGIRTSSLSSLWPFLSSSSAGMTPAKEKDVVGKA